MKKRRTTEEFIKKSQEIHGLTAYNYDLTIYTTARAKVIIICPEHGKFEQVADTHLRGSGCPACGKLQSEAKRRSTISSFIERANIIHNHKYTYESVVYKNAITAVNITCKIHGPFKQLPDCHLRGSGCPTCALEKKGTRRLTQEEFERRAEEVHGDIYDYSLSKYETMHKKVRVLCPFHGEWLVTPNALIFGQSGCPSCSESRGENLVRCFLDSLGVIYEEEKTFDELMYRGKLRLDFYIEEKKIAIEFQGCQHFYPTKFSGNVTDQQAEENLRLQQVKDSIKRLFCKNHGIRLIEIDYRAINNDLLNTKILSKEFLTQNEWKEIFNLTETSDWAY